MPTQFDPKHWRDRADEMRASAESAKDQTAKVIMLQIARDFDRLAARAHRDEPARPAP